MKGKLLNRLPLCDTDQSKQHNLQEREFGILDFLPCCLWGNKQHYLEELDMNTLHAVLWQAWQESLLKGSIVAGMISRLVGLDFPLLSASCSFTGSHICVTQ